MEKTEYKILFYSKLIILNAIYLAENYGKCCCFRRILPLILGSNKEGNYEMATVFCVHSC